MRWLLLLVGIGCLAWSLSMAPGLFDAVPGVRSVGREITYGPGEDIRAMRLERDTLQGMVDAGFDTPARTRRRRISELTDEILRRSGAATLNLVGWGSLIGFGALSWRKKRKQATPPAQQ